MAFESWGGMRVTKPGLIASEPAWPKPPRHLMHWLVGLVVVACGIMVAFPLPLAPVAIQLPITVLGTMLLWRMKRMGGMGWREPAVLFALALASQAAGLVLLFVQHIAPDCNACPFTVTLPAIFFLGTRLFAAFALLNLAMKRKPRIALTYWLAMLSFTVTIMLVDLTPSSLSWSLPWCVSDLLVLFLAMPHLEGVLRGEAPSARLFWIMGWQIMWMAAALELFARHDVVTPTTIVPSMHYQAVYVLSNTFLALGYYGECRRWDMGLWPYVLGTGAVLVSWAIGLLFFRTLPAQFFWTWLGMGALTFLMSTTGLLMSYLHATDRAARALVLGNANLERVRRAKGDFLASMTHELRTPLNAIIGFSEALRDGLVAEFDALQTNLLDEIHHAGDSLLLLVNRILDLSKLEAGKMTLHHGAVHVESLLHEAAQPYQEPCRARGIALVVHVAPDAPTEISGDVERLKTVLQDLLDNALRETDKGAMRLEAKAWHETGHHATAEAEPQSFVQISCSDTGKGMTQDQLTRAFAAFESNQRPGLGLALAKGFTEAHGGTMHIESTLGQGTTVYLRLPCGKGMATAPAVTQQMAQGHEAARVIRARRQDTTSQSRASGTAAEPSMESRPMPLWPWLAVLVACGWYMVGRGSRDVYLVQNMFFYTMTVLILWRIAGPWRLVGAGQALWLIGNVFLYAWVNHPHDHFIMLFQLSFHLGYLFLCPGYLRLKPRERPGGAAWGLFLCLAAISSYPVLGLLYKGIWFSGDVSYPIMDLVLLACALPALQPVIMGRVSIGRLLLGFGLLVNLYLDTVGSIAHRNGYGEVLATLNMPYSMSALLIAIGAVAEARRWTMPYAAPALGLGCVLLFWSLGISGLRAYPSLYVFLVISGVLIFFIGGLAVLAHHQARAALAQAELRASQLALEEANAAKSRFLASMSHHLRTPLNAVLGFADALKAELAGKIPDEAREYLDDIESAGEHLLALMDDILDITAVETEELRHELRTVDLGRLLRNSLAIVKERATKRGVALELHVGPGVDGLFTLDERALKQILFNYLSNAVKFTPGGGKVSLVVTIVDGMSMLAYRGLAGFATDGHLAKEDHALEKQRFFCFAVTDTGPGIKPEDQKRLFQPYSQTDLAQGKEGTGLGLVMVKRLAEMCGGAVALESTPGQGSTFYAWVGCVGG